MVEQDTIKNVIEALAELENDVSVPKNIKIKLLGITNTLKESGENSIKVNKVLQEIENILEDINMQSYTRTQLFNIVSLLEIIA